MFDPMREDTPTGFAPGQIVGGSESSPRIHEMSMTPEASSPIRNRAMNEERIEEESYPFLHRFVGRCRLGARGVLPARTSDVNGDERQDISSVIERLQQQEDRSRAGVR
jgi:hypothetical protein